MALYWSMVSLYKFQYIKSSISSHITNSFDLGKQFHLKGVNWFGGTNSRGSPHGLWATDIDTMMDFMSTNGFNAVRWPLSLDVTLNNPIVSEPTVQ